MTDASRTTGERLDVDRLLRIDIAAEVRKLARAQIEGPWQLPVELVRRALRDGATAVDVRLGRGRVEVSAIGDRCHPGIPDALATIARADADADAAHRAVLALEDGDQFGLLALKGVETRRMRVALPTRDDRVVAVTIHDGRAEVREERRGPLAPTDGSVVVLDGAELDVRRARRELQRAARLCPVPVRVDGVEVNIGAPDAYAVEDLPTPGGDAPRHGLRGRVAIRPTTETPVVWVLRHGLLATHLTLTAGPAVEFAIDVAGTTNPRATREDLRVTIERAAPQLLVAAVDVLETLSRQPGVGVAARARIAELALQAARVRALAPRVARMPLFEVLEDGLPIGRVPLVELRAATREERGRRVVLALGPGDDPRDHECHGRVFVLDEPLRAWLSEALDIGVRPPNRHARTGWRARLRARLSAARAAVAGWLPAARGIPRASWSDAELALISTLESLVVDRHAVTLVERGEPRWRGRTLALPRAHDEVRAALAIIEDDPAWTYPVALALAGPHLRVRDARRTWTMRAWAR